MARRVVVDLREFAANFASGVKKIAEGAVTPNCDIRLTHEECKALAEGLRSLGKRRG